MQQVKLVDGRRYVCRVVHKRRQSYASFSVTGGTINSSLVDFAAKESGLFSERQRSTFETPLTLQAEEGWYASLFDSFSSGTHFFGTGAEVESIASNIAVIGYAPWAMDAAVKRIRFKLPEVEPEYRITGEYRRVAESDWRGYKDSRLFSAELDDMVCDLRLAPTWTGPIKKPSSIDIVYGIDLKTEKSLTQVGQILHCIERYFTTISGRLARATEITVSQLNSDQEQEVLEEGHLHWHDLILYSGEAERAQREDYFGRFPFVLSNKEGVDNLAACLKDWIVNFERLAVSSNLMALALKNDSVISQERLLGGTRWLEATPSATAKGYIAKDHAKEVGRIVDNYLRSAGYSDAVAGRAVSAVGKVSLESNEHRFKRLVSQINEFYGGSILDDDAVDWLLEAFRFRGAVAHGGKLSSTDLATDLECAIYTVEATSFLLLLKQLPLSPESRAMLCEHTCVYGYRHGARGKKPSRKQ